MPGRVKRGAEEATGARSSNLATRLAVPGHAMSVHPKDWALPRHIATQLRSDSNRQ